MLSQERLMITRVSTHESNYLNELYFLKFNATLIERVVSSNCENGMKFKGDQVKSESIFPTPTRWRSLAFVLAELLPEQQVLQRAFRGCSIGIIILVATA